MKIIALIFLITISLSASTEVEKLKTIQKLIDKHGIDFFMTKILVQEQNEYPKKKSKLETITSLFYIELSNKKVYKHRVVKDWREIVKGENNFTTEEVNKYYPMQMQEQSINSICSYKVNRLLLKNGVKIINIYNEFDGSYIFETTVSYSDCLKKYSN